MIYSIAAAAFLLYITNAENSEKEKKNPVIVTISTNVYHNKCLVSKDLTLEHGKKVFVKKLCCRVTCNANEKKLKAEFCDVLSGYDDTYISKWDESGDAFPHCCPIFTPAARIPINK
uniref:Putative secreted protein n=1 Tax=Amblyomma triste TaxID=251400 RepID=A0A023G4C3_AMBTT